MEEYLREKAMPADIVHSSANHMGLMPLSISKGHDLTELIALLGCRRDDVITVGDNLNDLELLEGAGLGVAVGNAHQDVKLAAKLCVCSNDEHAVACIINMLENGRLE